MKYDVNLTSKLKKMYCFLILFVGFLLFGPFFFNFDVQVTGCIFGKLICGIILCLFNFVKCVSVQLEFVFGYYEFNLF